MKPKSVTTFAFAGAILASTIGAANSTPFHSSRASYHTRGHVAGLSSHHRGTQHVARSHGGSTGEGTSKRTVANAAIEGGLMSGIASVYSGERTANGEYARAGGLTAAHRSLPFGTMVRVTNRGTGQSVVVRINDRGPFVHGRVIDLTPAAAHAIGSSGLAPVTLAVVSRN